MQKKFSGMLNHRENIPFVLIKSALYFKGTAPAYSAEIYSVQPTRVEQNEGPNLNWNFHFIRVLQGRNAFLTSGWKYGIVFHLMWNQLTILIHLNIRSKKIVSKILKKRKKIYTSSIKTLHHLSQTCLALETVLYWKHLQYHPLFFFLYFKLLY